MTTWLAAAGTDAGQRNTRRLILIWQDPRTHSFVRVAHLDEFTSGGYVFTYEPGAVTDGFTALAEFPDLDRAYARDRLPAFFDNRVMDSGRRTYGDYRGWLGLAEDGADTPFEVMVRTGAGRATDTFNVVDDLRVDGAAVSTRFFLAGVGHVDGAAETIAGLAAGSVLQLRRETTNTWNSLALLLYAAPSRPVGWVPDWLVDDVTRLLERSAEVIVLAEKVNPDAPPHLRMLCLLTAFPA